MNALPKCYGAVVEVILRNQETAEMVRDMLDEERGEFIDAMGIKRYSDGWVLHVLVSNEVRRDIIIGRIHVLLNIKGVTTMLTSEVLASTAG